MTSQPRRTSALKAWGITLACLAVTVAMIATVLVALGIRPEHPDMTPAEPSSAEAERQNLAIFAQRIASSAELASADPDLAAAATQWIDALGGVWVPWPDGAPEGYSNPDIDVSAYADAPALSAALWEFVGALVEFTDDDMAQLPRAEIQGDGKRSAGTNKEQAETDATHSAKLRAAQNTAPLSARILIDVIPHAVLVDKQIGTPHEYTLDTSAIAQLLSNDPAVLRTLDRANQQLESAQALLSSEQRAPFAKASTILLQAINVGLDAGASDTREVMAEPTDDVTAGSAIARTAFAELIGQAQDLPEEESRSVIDAAVAFQCSFEQALAGS